MRLFLNIKTFKQKREFFFKKVEIGLNFEPARLGDDHLGADGGELVPQVVGLQPRLYVRVAVVGQTSERDESFVDLLSPLHVGHDTGADVVHNHFGRRGAKRCVFAAHDSIDVRSDTFELVFEAFVLFVRIFVENFVILDLNTKEIIVKIN
jgi:hypothetical protein